LKGASPRFTRNSWLACTLITSQLTGNSFLEDGGMKMANKMKQEKGMRSEGLRAPGRGPMEDRLARGERGLRERQQDYERQDDRVLREQTRKQGALPPERNR
jgi:hypothetical protein